MCTAHGPFFRETTVNVPFYSALLLPIMGEEEEKGFVQLVGEHLVGKLVSVRGNHHSQSVQLLRGLSVLCECQGAPIQQNQSEFMNDKNDKLFVISVLLCIAQILECLQRAFRDDEEVKIYHIHCIQYHCTKLRMYIMLCICQLLFII